MLRYYRGGKTALTLALHAPDLISSVIAVDNCPIHLPLVEDFPRYLRAMAGVRDARAKTLREADEILKKYEEVCTSPFIYDGTPHIFFLTMS